MLIAIEHMPNNCLLRHYKIKDNILIDAYTRLNVSHDIIGYWED